MKTLKKISAAAVMAAAAIALTASPASADSTPWKLPTRSYDVTLKGCRFGLIPYHGPGQDYASVGDGSCSGSVGVQTQHNLYQGSPVYTGSVKWGTSYARLNAEILRAAKAHK